MSISADEFNEKSPLNSDQPKTLTTVISNRKANRSVFLNPEFKTDKFEIKFDENNFSFLDQNQNQCNHHYELMKQHLAGIFQ